MLDGNGYGCGPESNLGKGLGWTWEQEPIVTTLE